ncbi:hypothetical protein WP50_09710 [Lactiplantibacillus plantarum]|nr:hypothetical protein WP50_09710 [Lactiplantibacillus plantarum]
MPPLTNYPLLKAYQHTTTLQHAGHVLIPDEARLHQLLPQHAVLLTDPVATPAHVAVKWVGTQIRKWMALNGIKTIDTHLGIRNNAKWLLGFNKSRDFLTTTPGQTSLLIAPNYPLLKAYQHTTTLQHAGHVLIPDEARLHQEWLSESRD